MPSSSSCHIAGEPAKAQPTAMEVDVASQCFLDSIRPAAPAAKTMPKSSAKSAPKGKAKGKAKAKSAAPPPSLADAPPVAVPPKDEPENGGPAQKKLRLSPIEDMDPKLTGNMAAHMIESDKAWASETLEKIKAFMCLAPREAEGEFKADVGDRVRELTNLQGLIRKRIRSVKRRTVENQEAAMIQAEEMETTVSYLICFLKNLTKGGNASGHGDELHNQYKSLVEQGAVLGVEVVKRIARDMVLDDIRHQRWPRLIDVTWNFIKTNMSKLDSDGFFANKFPLLCRNW